MPAIREITHEPSVELIGCQPLNDTPAVAAAERRRLDEIDAIFHSLSAHAGETLPGCGSPANRPDDCTRRLVANATILHGLGLTCPEEVDAWIANAWRTDVYRASLSGLANNLGYAAGMTTASEVWAGQLPKEVLQDPAYMGLVLGLVIGTMDVAIASVGGRAVEARMLNPRCSPEQMPVSCESPPPLKQFISKVLRNSAMNVAKNSMRILAPMIQNRAEGDPHGLLNRATSDRADVGIDAFGGFVPSIASQVMDIGRGSLYRARLVMRGDLQDIYTKSQEGWGTASGQASKGALKGAVSLIDPRSPVPAALVAVIGMFISNLFSTNANIDRTGTAKAEMAGNFSIPEDRIDYRTATLKRASSTFCMGTMVTVLPVVAVATDMVFGALTSYLAGKFPVQRTPHNPSEAHDVELGNADPDIQAA